MSQKSLENQSAIHPVILRLTGLPEDVASRTCSSRPDPALDDLHMFMDKAGLSLWYVQMVCYGHIINVIEGSLEVKLPTIWTDEKQRWEE